MFREMRRQNRRLMDEETAELLERCQYGVLSTTDIDGYSYGVPLSFVYIKGNIYFHCATEGHKLDNIRDNDRVSFCVVGEVAAVPEKFTTKYESAIAFGRAAEVYGDEKYTAFLALLEKYSNQYIEKGMKYMKSDDEKVKVIKIYVEHITGKANR